MQHAQRVRSLLMAALVAVGGCTASGPQQQQIVALAYPFMTEAKLPQATSTPLN